MLQAEEAQRREEELQDKLRRKKKKAKKMGRRPRRGQPVMENQIDSLLAKLQGEAEAVASR